MANDRQPEDPRERSFAIANLAMWAGDYVVARKLLSEAVDGVDPENDVAGWGSAAHHLLRKLEASLRDRSRSWTSAERLEILELYASGDHLKGIVLRESDYEFTMRAYLVDLTWEGRFYERASEIAGAYSRLQYGNDESQAIPAVREAARLSIAWVVEGRLFTRVHISDFGTMTCQGVWTKAELPTSLEPIGREFQVMLDRVDPRP